MSYELSQLKCLWISNKYHCSLLVLGRMLLIFSLGMADLFDFILKLPLLVLVFGQTDSLVPDVDLDQAS
jgi:hypothetical protein